MWKWTAPVYLSWRRKPKAAWVRSKDNPPALVKPSWAVCLLKPPPMTKDGPYAMKIRPPTQEPSKQPNSLAVVRSEEHTSELQSLAYLVCRLLLEKKKKNLDY